MVHKKIKEGEWLELNGILFEVHYKEQVLPTGKMPRIKATLKRVAWTTPRLKERVKQRRKLNEEQ